MSCQHGNREEDCDLCIALDQSWESGRASGLAEINAVRASALVEIDTLKAELAAAREDAERYRMLRDDDDTPVWVSVHREWGGSQPLTGAALDAAIDAARAKEKGNG